MKQLNHKFISTFILSLSAFSLSSALAGPIRGIGPKELKPAEIKAAREVAARELAKVAGLKEAEVREFFGRSHVKAEAPIWTELLVRTTTAGIEKPTPADFQTANRNADLVAALVRIQKSAPEAPGSITARDVLEVQRNWTAKEQSNFFQVLERASQIAKTSQVSNQAEAFRLALKEKGLLEKFEKGCKR
jgi:hypothetical protein